MSWHPKSTGGVEGKQYLQNLLWSAILGLASSLACVAVRGLFRLLQWLFTGHAGLLSDAADHLPLWRRFITPAIGAFFAMAVIWATKRFTMAQDFEEYVEAVRLSDGRISFGPTLWRTLASAFSVATGAAIGREGSMIQFATSVTSALGQRLRFSRMPLTLQVACGVSAAVATAYQAPIAGMFFAAEIVLGRLVLAEIPLLLVSAFAGSLTGRYLLGGGPLFVVHAHIGIDTSHVLFALLLATFMGVLGPGYSLLTRSLRATAKWPLPLLWSGILVGLLSLVCTEVWGNGDAALLSIMHASPAVPAVLTMLALRLCATTFCVGTGAVGGAFTPTLFVGSAIGLLTTHFVHVSNPVFFAIVGMGCLLAAVTHAPLMATMIALELTGQWMLLPAILLCNVVAWSIARRISPYSLYALATPEPVGSPAGHDRTAPSEDISRQPLPARMRLGTSEPPPQMKIGITMMEEGVDG